MQGCQIDFVRECFLDTIYRRKSDLLLFRTTVTDHALDLKTIGALDGTSLHVATGFRGSSSKQAIFAIFAYHSTAVGHRANRQ